nr:glucose-1-phosphate adenylyltransferase subunit GlgD [Evansella caseinilytica]
MDTLMGVINLDYELDLLNELTYFRCGASVPFAGRYRIIDFSLSNMVNTSIQEVAIFARAKYRSLMDHLGTGGDWELDRKHGGLFILPPDWNDPTDISRGDLSHFHNNRDFFTRGRASHILVSGSQFISNTDYEAAFQSHLERNAEVTLICTEVNELTDEHSQCLRVETDEDGWVTDLSHDAGNHYLFTGVYILGKELLLDLVDDCIAHYKSHFFFDGIKEKVGKLKIQAHSHVGYSAYINSVESYYRHSMNLLDARDYRELFMKKPFVKTKVSSQPPMKYCGQANVSNCLLANGCSIDGTVENSILFRGVKVKRGAVIKNSIIMQRCTIEENVHLENVILDKDVVVTKDKTFIGAKEQPYVVPKRKVM